jgi:hypothetical protein
MEASCQCGKYTFTIPRENPSLIVICHCDRCKQVAGSAFLISAVFPNFPHPNSINSPDIVGKYSTSSESGNGLDGYFCKGCGNRMIHQADGPGCEEWVSVSAPRIKGFDWGLLKDKALVQHYWTGKAVVPILEGFVSFEENPCF